MAFTYDGCPLCCHGPIAGFHHDERRDYLQCAICRLVFVPPAHYLTPESEKAHYDRHHNDPADERYRRFLSRLFQPMVRRLQPNDEGLDFGSGPGPTLSRMFEEAGHPMTIYDPFYAADPQALTRQYDFITASEVVEHLHHPRRELDRLWSLLKCGGWLGIMTKRVRDAQAFARWHYKLDPTHIMFFSMETFAWLAQQWAAELVVEGDDVVLLHKSRDG